MHAPAKLRMLASPHVGRIQLRSGRKILRAARCKCVVLKDRPAEIEEGAGYGPGQDIERKVSNQAASTSGSSIPSVSRTSTREWEEKYAPDGCVDLWVEEEFNAGSRLTRAGVGSGEGPSKGGVPSHKVKIFNHHTSQEIEVDVPEDRYILFEAEDHGLLLPWACRMGCCTTCAVRVKEGEVFQPQSLGVSKQLRDAGYALMCVAFPTSDVVLETVEEDELYDLQFGRAFAERALKPSDRDAVERDDFAWEMANMDE